MKLQERIGPIATETLQEVARAVQTQGHEANRQDNELARNGQTLVIWNIASDKARLVILSRRSLP